MISEAEMKLFRELSRDPNPLHWDAEFAQQRGFAGPVVYGGLLVTAISRLLGEQLPGPGCVWHGLKLDFRHPLYVGQPATLRAVVRQVSPAIQALRLELRIFTDEHVVATGEATVIAAWNS